MAELDILPAPVLNLPPPPEDKWRREQRAFQRLLPELLDTCRGKYVAVHEEQVVDRDDDLVTLATRVYRRHGYVPIYMDLVTERPPVVRIPHYRVLGNA